MPDSVVTCGWIEMHKRTGRNPDRDVKDQDPERTNERPCNGEVTFPQYNLQEFPWRVLALLWCLVTVMLIGVPYLASIVPPSPRTDIQWWKNAVVYQMPTNTTVKGQYFKEFAYNKIEELHDLGINAVRLSNFFHFAPDRAVLDYMSINRDYGSLADFLSLMELLKEKDIKMMIDVPVAYTSTAHQWFKEDESDKSRDSIFLWKDTPEIKDDNNLEKYWSKSSVRQEYYLHVKDQPQLALINYSSKEAYNRLQTVFHYWINHGVSGFILINCDKLIFSEPDIYSPTHLQVEHSEDVKLQKLTDLIQNIKADFNGVQLQLDNNKRGTDNNVILAMDIDCGDDSTCQTLFKSGVDLVVNKHFFNLPLDVSSEATDLIHLERNVKRALSRVPKMYTHNWMICQEDSSIHNIRDDRTLQLINMIHLFLPGTAFICDAQLPQKQSADFASAREHFKTLVEWRQTWAMSWGQIQLNFINEEVFSFVRYGFGKMYPRYIIIVNLGRNTHRRYNFTMKQKGLVVPELGTLRYSTCPENVDEPFRYANNSSIFLNDTLLKPRCGLLVEMNLKISW